MKRLAFLLFLLFAVQPAFADSIAIYKTTFSNVTNILMVPGVDQNFAAEKFPAGVSSYLLYFDGVFFTPQISSLTWTFTSAAASAPQVASFPPESCPVGQCEHLVAFLAPGVPSTDRLIAASLTVNLNGTVQQTYNFHYAFITPEPTTFLLLGTGLAAVVWRRCIRPMKK